MRLTLRTMLAYMDEILEPEDADDIGKKIQESDFATELLQKTRNCVRLQRLGAPPLAGRGIALDANSVAEYLDNTLAGERVPDFEKVCLESDIHLAEVAGCHQILTLVLGEPADVESLNRDRMYQLPASAAASPPMPAPPVGARPPVPPVQTQVPPMIRRPKPEVPDYLREPRSRLLTVAAALLIGIILGGGTLLWLGPAEYRQRFVSWFAPSNSTDDQPDDAKGSDESDRATGKEPDKSTKSIPDVGANRGSDSGDSAESAASTAQEELDQDGDADHTAANEAVAEGSAAGDEATDDQSTAGAAASNKTTIRIDGQTVEPEEMATEETTDPDADPAVDQPAANEVAGTGLGRYLSEPPDVLLRFEPDAATWRRLPTKSILAAEDRLLAFPLFKPTISLSTGVSIQEIGPAVVTLGAPDRRGIPAITIEYGRAHLLTVSKPQNQIWIRIGEHQGLLTFGNEESAVSFDVRWSVPPGQDPETTPAAVSADLYVTNGQIRWEEDGAEESLKAPARFTIAKAGASADAGGGEFPKWINAEASPLDKRAITALEKGLLKDRSVALSLKELSDRPQFEVKSLGIRSGAYIGQFEPVVAALNDPDQHAAWPAQIEALKSALARGPEVAAQVRATFEKQRGGDAKELYRMLWSYSSEDLKQGAANTLVDYLNHDSLDFRVLSFNNLQSITNMGLLYQPQDPPKKRAPHIQKWKEKLKDGKVVPASAATTNKPTKAAGRTLLTED